ncbi:hypothetical protein V6N12_017060 [Hibiscus sabdariffa]|uniref:Uncharacterized protein n=1 Tax=Hibiscus sabdariffa TaxID=183260 RepID=A0ABR2ALM9_9ROSI
MSEEEQPEFIRMRLRELRSTMMGIENNPAPRQGTDQTQRVHPKIQRVPPSLWPRKEELVKYFQPRMVALGPLHHGNPVFRRAEQTKLILTSLFLLESRTGEEFGFSRIMREIDDLQKCYYHHDIHGFDDNALAWMLFVDGCAVLYAIYSIIRQVELPSDLNIQGDVIVLVSFDIWLLENQLPYRVLKILIESTSDPQPWEESIRDLIHKVTKPPSERNSALYEDCGDYAHLLERFRTQLLVRRGIEESSCSMVGRMLLWSGDIAEDKKTVNSVMDLKESGIQVRRNKTDNIKDISFHCKLPAGILKVPLLVVSEVNACTTMNLVALESCPDFVNDSSVKAYIRFVSSLIQTPQDVKELRVRGVLQNYLGSEEEVADLFRVCRDLRPDLGNYDHIFRDMERYCNSWFIRIYSDYFGAKWSLLTFLVAITGLVLTLLQTYYEI